MSLVYDRPPYPNEPGPVPMAENENSGAGGRYTSIEETPVSQRRDVGVGRVIVMNFFEWKKTENV